MDLHDWLLHNRYLTCDEYKQIVDQQTSGSLSDAKFDRDGFIVSDSTVDIHVTAARKHPIGDVIKANSLRTQIFKRADVAGLAELVQRCQQWHVEHLEPIGNYSTVSRFGRNLYDHAYEKKLAAWFVSNARVRGNSIIKNGDTVVIPDGSSAFYIALGIAQWRERVTIITSNGPLYSEYLNNPALAGRYRDFHVVGGLADKDDVYRFCDAGGVFGPDAEGAYHRAIKVSPKATVIVMPVSGLLPEDGPFALQAASRALKLSIIRDGLDEGVREIVFVADYSKHLHQSIDSYGGPVMAKRTWDQTLEDCQGQVSLVTVPPPGLRKFLAVAPVVHPAARKRLESFEPPFSGAPEDYGYNLSASRFGAQFHDKNAKLMFHEACDWSDAISQSLARK